MLAPQGVEREDCVVVHTLPELSAVVKAYPSDDLFVIGGAMFYHTMLPFCDTVYVTKVSADGNATVFFDDLDALANWRQVEEGAPIEDNGQTIRFCTYVNDAPLPF